MRLWETDFTTETGLQGLFAPKCKHCDVMGDFYMAKCYKFVLHDDFVHHTDVEMKCPECGYWWVHEVTISEEHYNWFSERFGNVFSG